MLKGELSSEPPLGTDSHETLVRVPVVIAKPNWDKDVAKIVMM